MSASVADVAAGASLRQPALIAKRNLIATSPPKPERCAWQARDRSKARGGSCELRAGLVDFAAPRAGSHVAVSSAAGLGLPAARRMPRRRRQR